MAHIVFFEKPGCINNTKQKNWLEAAGHTVDAQSILDHPWQAEELRSFLPGDEPAVWFNRTAPAIKSGAFNPDACSESEAISAMLNDHLLIKRPLMQIAETRLQGFDKERIDQLIGLAAAPGKEDTVAELDADNLTVCPQINNRCD